MKTSLIRKTIENCYGNITIECESQNTPEEGIVISCMNDSIVVEHDNIPRLIAHLQILQKELFS